MEKELNIAAILKDKPEETKLWSPICGECKLHLIKMSNPEPIEVAHGNNGGIITLSKDGKYFLKGESILFPSKQMRDWSKFAWKKGDVLTDNISTICMFDGWTNDDYTEFKAKYTLHLIASTNAENEVCKTNNFVSVLKEEDRQSYLATVETYFNVNLTKGSLEIEQPKPEFKDGDIVFNEGNRNYSSGIGIIKKDKYGSLMWNVLLTQGKLYCKSDSYIFLPCRQATDSEKQQLYDALANENKAWDEDKKMLVDLPKKDEFKPMDWCLMRYKGHYNNRGWELCQYAYTEHRTSYFDNKSKDFYHAVGGEIYAECIPYNDSTKHLLGTTDEWKGGEG